MCAINIDEQFWSDFESKVSCALVPCFKSDAVRPCAKEDFQDYTKNLEKNLRLVIVALDHLLQHESQWPNDIKENLTKVFIIIGEQHQESAWNTGLCSLISTELSIRICTIFKCGSITEILRDDGTFASIVMFLRPKLIKDTWKSNPAAVICYKWLLGLVEKPLLRKHLTEILPAALIIFDDYVPENQKIGLNCIRLIIEHCQQSRNLRNLGYDEVIYQALEKMLYKVRPSMIIPVYSCALTLIENIEFCDDKSKFGWSRRDDVLVILLDNMELQSEPECRYAYAMSLKKLLNFSSSNKQFRRLSRILSEYCENGTDLKTTDVALDIIKMLMTTCPPFNVNFYTSIYASLLKLCLELSLKQNVTIIRGKACECVSLINNLNSEMLTEILNNKIVKSALQDINLEGMEI